MSNDFAEAISLLENGLKAYAEQLAPMRQELAKAELTVQQYKKMIADTEEFEAKLQRSLLAVRALAAEQGVT